MRRKFLLGGLVSLLVAVVFGFYGLGARPVASAAPESEGPSTSLGENTPFSFDASYIEACSCLLFCPCYFNSQAQHDYCRFNMAVVVRDGQAGEVSLKGARYWLAGDLGEHWGTEGKSPWLVITFDPSVTAEQRDALVKIYPVEWGDVQLDESEITWMIRGNEARARLANGNGEMVLERFGGDDGDKVVLDNVKYWAADTNNGFVLHKSKIHRWDGFGHKYEYSGRNAFTIRLQAKGTL